VHPALFEHSNAARLRGRRFWLPLIILLVATGTATYFLQRDTNPAKPPPATQSLAGVDAVIRGLLTRLEADKLFCGDLQATATTHVSCLLGGQTVRTTFESFPSHRALVAALPARERTARELFRSTGVVSYLLSGGRWLASGRWSATGNYGADTLDSSTAQAMTRQLDGCLELLPREAGSCVF
jgi:hypothetical protein